eukprot:TRINITY_DN12172_c0_g1_i4.p1 TRINITY_DN12172_c0_g1~~TRINITY_DN12172_c0_g1_i4.p1  ORF type:complete len:306 (+),score=27.44 TRINITY_DN12172_c0_g1_i4:76-993(+)
MSLAGCFDGVYAFSADHPCRPDDHTDTEAWESCSETTPESKLPAASSGRNFRNPLGDWRRFAREAAGVLTSRCSCLAFLHQQSRQRQAVLQPTAPRLGGRSALESLLIDRLFSGRREGHSHKGEGVGTWRNADAAEFRVRDGPQYRRFGRKRTSGPAAYACIGCDVVMGQEQVKSVLTSLRAPPLGAIAEPRCKLPELLVINFQAPFQPGPLIPGRRHPTDDSGCSIVICLRLERWAAQEAQDMQSARPAIKLLGRYFHDEAHPPKEGNQVSLCLKSIGKLMNVEEATICYQDNMSLTYPGRAVA